MKGIAIGIYPSKEKETLITYTSLSTPDSKHEIRIEQTETFRMHGNGPERVREIAKEFAERAGKIIPIVFGAHQVLGFTHQSLLNTSHEVLFSVPHKSVYPKIYQPLNDRGAIDLSDEKVDEMNRSFGVIVDLEGQFTPEEDKKLERIAAQWARENGDTITRYFGIYAHDDYIISRIIKKGGVWAENFGFHLCKYLGGNRNVCMKPLGWKTNPVFADVAASYIAGNIDEVTGDEPCFVGAIRGN